MRQGKRAAPRRRRLTRLLLPLLVLALALSWALYDSNCRLMTQRFTVPLSRLPESFEGFRIIHISDLHGMSFGRDNRRLAQLIRSQEPDLIAYTGDIAGKKGELSAVEPLLRELEGLCPAYYVNGNHEWADGCVEEIEALMENYGVRCLSNEIDLLYRGEDSIAVIGAEDPNGRADMMTPWELSLRAGELYSGKFMLWLAHRNDYMKMYPDIGTDLILCGHAHGGIVRLPFVGGLLNVNRSLGAEYEAGLYCSEHYIMEVSRGLGNSIPIPRLFNRPELVVIELSRNN